MIEYIHRKELKKKGFTLIELLVVIAIIGMLSSVILSALNSARGKGKDAAVKEDLANIRSQAQLYYDGNNGSYSGMCLNANVQAMYQGASQVSQGNSTSYVCNSGGVSGSQVWAISVPLSSGSTYWCVDWTGNSKSEAAALGVNVTTCP